METAMWIALFQCMGYLEHGGRIKASWGWGRKSCLTPTLIGVIADGQTRWSFLQDYLSLLRLALTDARGSQSLTPYNGDELPAQSTSLGTG